MNTKQAIAIIAARAESAQQLVALETLARWRENSPTSQQRANAVLKAALQEKLWDDDKRELFTGAIVPVLDKKEVRQVRLAAELYEAVQREAKRAGMSAQEFMRKAIEEKVERQR